MSILGSALSFVTGSAVDVFYRRRIIGGAIPAHGPLLLVANHPNALLDPVVVQNAALAPFSRRGRRVRMLAKAPLFSMPGVSILVKGMDCLPVYRPKDGADTKNNADTFRAVEEALVAGSCVLIFPEGISHDEPSVQPLKTGAARMAIGAQAKGADVVVVPVGLSYADKLRFRSTAAVDIGLPIRVAEFMKSGAGDDDERDAVKALTAAIHEGLQQVTVNLESWEDLPLLEAVDAIWRQDDPERVRRIQNLAAGTAALRARDPARFDELRTRLSDWLARLDELGLRPHDVADGAVQARRDPAKLLAFGARNVVAALFAFPLALLGAVFWAVPFWAVHALWLVGRPERDTGATVKVLAGLVLFPLWFVAAVAAVAWFVDPVVAAVIAVVAPGAGMTTRHFFRRRFFALQQVWAGLRLAFRGRLNADLVRERDAFCAAFDDVAAATRAAPPRAGDVVAPGAGPGAGSGRVTSPGAGGGA